MASQFPTLLLNNSDNVAVALDHLGTGTTAQPGIKTRQQVAKGHKIAIAPIGIGGPVLKFGQTIGFASVPIEPGEWVHEHNCSMGQEGGSFAGDYDFGTAVRPVNFVPEAARATFEGYRRPNGKVGTRNYIGILTSVNCSATVARFIADAVNRSGMLEDYPQIDGVVSFVHSTGCGMANHGEGFEILSRTQWGYASNPNLGAILRAAGRWRGTAPASLPHFRRSSLVTGRRNRMVCNDRPRANTGYGADL